MKKRRIIRIVVNSIAAVLGLLTLIFVIVIASRNTNGFLPRGPMIILGGLTIVILVVITVIVNIVISRKNKQQGGKQS